MTGSHVAPCWVVWVQELVTDRVVAGVWWSGERHWCVAGDSTDVMVVVSFTQGSVYQITKVSRPVTSHPPLLLSVVVILFTHT